MKIVSIQGISVGRFTNYSVGFPASIAESPASTVKRIELKSTFTWTYEVFLENGHQLELPADKYIAEYAPDEDGDEK